MSRKVFHRDFTLCKAAALVLLMFLALALGGVPHEARDMAGEPVNAVMHVPATLWIDDALCDVAKTSGIAL